LKYCRVLPGGRQVGFLIAMPKHFTSQSALRDEIGIHLFDPDSAIALAHAQQVAHFVSKTYPGREDFIPGNPQVIDLPFKCGEGDLKVKWHYDPTNMTRSRVPSIVISSFLSL
jgi:hypothetical protein